MTAFFSSSTKRDIYHICEGCGSNCGNRYTGRIQHVLSPDRSKAGFTNHAFSDKKHSVSDLCHACCEDLALVIYRQTSKQLVRQDVRTECFSCSRVYRPLEEWWMFSNPGSFRTSFCETCTDDLLRSWWEKRSNENVENAKSVLADLKPYYASPLECLKANRERRKKNLPPTNVSPPPINYQAIRNIIAEEKKQVELARQEEKKKQAELVRIKSLTPEQRRAEVFSEVQTHVRTLWVGEVQNQVQKDTKSSKSKALFVTTGLLWVGACGTLVKFDHMPPLAQIALSFIAIASLMIFVSFDAIYNSVPNKQDSQTPTDPEKKVALLQDAARELVASDAKAPTLALLQDLYDIQKMRDKHPGLLTQTQELGALFESALMAGYMIGEIDRYKKTRWRPKKTSEETETLLQAGKDIQAMLQKDREALLEHVHVATLKVSNLRGEILALENESLLEQTRSLSLDRAQAEVIAQRAVLEAEADKTSRLLLQLQKPAS